MVEKVYQGVGGRLDLKVGGGGRPLPPLCMYDYIHITVSTCLHKVILYEVLRSQQSLVDKGAEHLVGEGYHMYWDQCI